MIGGISGNDWSVPEDCVRLSEGVELDEATGISSTGGNPGGCDLSPPNIPSPHLLCFLKGSPSLSLLPVDCIGSWPLMCAESCIKSGSICGRDGYSWTIGEL